LATDTAARGDWRGDGGQLRFTTALCYAGFGKNPEPSELRARTVKRPLLLRYLVLLLSLALVSGNAHAALHMDSAHQEPCPEEHAHHHGKTPLHQHRHDHGLACCCDCLGCTASAYLASALSVTPIYPPARIHYDALNMFLSGRALPPDPDPPRPGTLS
jgi:hypothetical protein